MTMDPELIFWRLTIFATVVGLLSAFGVKPRELLGLAFLAGFLYLSHGIASKIEHEYSMNFWITLIAEMIVLWVIIGVVMGIYGGDFLAAYIELASITLGLIGLGMFLWFVFWLGGTVPGLVDWMNDRKRP